MSKPLTIYLDFDGTVVEHMYPEIGKLVPMAIEVIEKLIKAGYVIELNTYRAELGLEKVIGAIHYLESENISIRTFLKIKQRPWDWDLQTAVEKQIMYIDDVAKGIPLIPGTQSKRPMVDWVEIDKQFKQYGIYGA